MGAKRRSGGQAMTHKLSFRSASRLNVGLCCYWLEVMAMVICDRWRALREEKGCYRAISRSAWGPEAIPRKGPLLHLPALQYSLRAILRLS